MASDMDPRVAALAAELLTRLELDYGLGIRHIAAAPPPPPVPAAAAHAAGRAAPSRPERTEASAPPIAAPTTAALPTESASARFLPASPAARDPAAPRPGRAAPRFGMPPEPPPLSDPELIPIRDAALSCTRCRLSEKRTRAAFGEGAVPADLMFVGEGPGREEDLSGRPFVGPAGRLLTRMIEGGLQIPRAAVYIANIVKCRPPGNRDPGRDEVEACFDYLVSQIRRVKPKALVALGAPAGRALLERPSAGMGSMRGQWHEWRSIPLRVVYHPAYLLREREAAGGHSEADRKTWDDLKEIKNKLDALASRS